MLLNILIVQSQLDSFSKITLPTRLQGASHTLIDNIWSSNMDENPLSKSGILINDISDHKMIFTYIENTAYVEIFKKFIKTEKRDEISFQTHQLGPRYEGQLMSDGGA